MRRMFAGLLIALGLSSGATSASAEDITINGVVRSISLFTAVRVYCPQADATAARKYEMAMTDVAARLVDRHSLDVLVRAEMFRRQKEVRITGAPQWCAYQRERSTNRPLFDQRN